MGQRLAGKTAWISGAASGIGAATARLFAEEGANVAAVDIRAGASVSIQTDVLKLEEQVRDSLGQQPSRRLMDWKLLSTARAWFTSRCCMNMKMQTGTGSWASISRASSFRSSTAFNIFDGTRRATS